VAKYRSRRFGDGRRAALDPAAGWRLDVERLAAACDERTRGILVNSPKFLIVGPVTACPAALSSPLLCFSSPEKGRVAGQRARFARDVSA
jgi:hypothetical protein